MACSNASSDLYLRAIHDSLLSEDPSELAGALHRVPMLGDALVVWDLILDNPGINQTGLRRLLKWRWERLRRTLGFLEGVCLRGIKGPGRSRNYFAQMGKRSPPLAALRREIRVRPALFKLLEAIDYAQNEGAQFTQKEWISMVQGTPGWSRRSFQRRIRRLKKLGVIEAIPHNNKRRSVYYFSRLRLRGKRVRRQLKDKAARIERMTRDVITALMPNGLDRQEREARRIVEEQGLVLDPPMRPAEDACATIDVKETWLLIERAMLLTSREDLAYLHRILESAKKPAR